MTSQEILLLEESGEQASRVGRWMGEAEPLANVCWVASLAEGLDKTRSKEFDAILLSLALPDVEGLDGLRELRRHCPDVPLIALAARASDAAQGAEAVANGADDFCVMEEPGHQLVRSVQFSLLRRKPAAFQAPTLRDGLTGLYNLSAFGVLGEHTIHTARRLGASVAVAVVTPLSEQGAPLPRVDLTHALQSSGRRLRGTSRQSDVVSRVETDQIAVLGIVDGAEGAEALVDRTLSEVACADGAAGVRWMSGVSVAPAERSTTLEGLLRRAISALEGATRELPTGSSVSG